MDMELIEKCFLTYVSIVTYHHSVTLGGINDYFIPNDNVSAYAKYVSGNAVWECTKSCSNHLHRMSQLSQLLTCRTRLRAGV